MLAGSAFAASPAVLWDQNTPSGGGFVFSENGAVAADDFVVPSGQTWLVKEVDVSGVYFNGSGPASSEVVTFYTNKHNLPNRDRVSFTLKCADNFGAFQCVLPKRVKLGAGTWWVSLDANCSFESCGEWGWFTNSTVHGNEAVYEDPSANSCTTWTPLHVCFGGSPADMAFAVLGRAVEN
jgi:hypothetical protein